MTTRGALVVALALLAHVALATHVAVDVTHEELLAQGVDLRKMHTPAALIEAQAEDEELHTAPNPCEGLELKQVTKGGVMAGLIGMFSQQNTFTVKWTRNTNVCYVLKPSLTGSSLGIGRVKMIFPKRGFTAADQLMVYNAKDHSLLDDSVDPDDANTAYYSPEGFILVWKTTPVRMTGLSGFTLQWSIDTDFEGNPSAGTSGKPPKPVAPTPSTPARPTSRPTPARPTPAPSTPATPSAPVTINPDSISIVTNVEANHAACNTNQYKSQGALIVRRECKFVLGLDPAASPLEAWVFSFADAKNTKTIEVRATVGAKAENVVEVVSVEGSKTTFKFLAAGAPIGNYVVQAKLKGGKLLKAAESIFVLFNPYSPADVEVYEADPKKREFYMEAVNGAVFQAETGTYWNFGTGDMSVLRGVIQTLVGLTAAERARAWRVAREFSWTANNLVIEGRWQETFPGAKDDNSGAIKYPWGWTGSGAILTAFHATKKRQQYGQCWVFSGVVKSQLNSVGILSASHTNMNSAHEHKHPQKGWDQKCDRFIVKGRNGALEYDSSKTRDSIWNFHVWDAAWIGRPDLNQNAPSWQAVDGTCQEASGPEGRCQMGPADMKSLKAGSVKGKYDQDFLAGETNCDVHDHYPDGQVQVDKCEVGSATYTLKYGTKPTPNSRIQADDVSSWYKDDSQCASGSLLEEEAGRPHFLPASKGRAATTVVQLDKFAGVPIGVDLTSLKGQEGKATWTVNVYPVNHKNMRLSKTPVATHSEEVAFGAKSKSKTLQIESFQAHLGKTNLFVFEHSYVAGKGSRMRRATVQFEMPSLTLTVGAVKNRVQELIIKGVNPLKIGLTKCKIEVSMARMPAMEAEKLANVAAGGKFTATVKIPAMSRKPRPKTTLAKVVCYELTSMDGRLKIATQGKRKRTTAARARIGKSGLKKFGEKRAVPLEVGKVKVGAAAPTKLAGKATAAKPAKAGKAGKAGKARKSSKSAVEDILSPPAL